jgi:hypothetical protein
VIPLALGFLTVEQAVETAGLEFDGIMGAHFVAAVATDAVFGVDLSGHFFQNCDHMFGTCVSAGTTGYTLGFNDPGEH